MKNTRELITNIRHMALPDGLITAAYKEISFVDYMKEIMDSLENGYE